MSDMRGVAHQSWKANAWSSEYEMLILPRAKVPYWRFSAWHLRTMKLHGPMQYLRKHFSLTVTQQEDLNSDIPAGRSHR